MLKVKGAEKGFTIIELMIATSVLSIMLLMVTVMMINIGNLYYKGISQARVQDNVRSITDEISKRLELGDHFFLVPDHPLAGAERAYCIGNTRYTFILYKQIDTDSRHVLWRDTNPSPGSCPSNPADLPNLNQAIPSAGGTELLAPHARLTAFTITGNSPYDVTISEAYGDSDLLCDNGTNHDCVVNDNPASVVRKLVSGTLAGPAGTIRCRGDIGEQFCATAILDTKVVKRLP
jgi:prepilin-type N-terminal cleavage/methylation domain-containing protein